MRAILVAVDGSEGADRALDFAAELAAKFDLELVIFHAIHEPPGRAAYDVEQFDSGLKALMDAERITPAELYDTLARELLDRAKARVTARLGAGIHTFWRMGDPAETTLAVAAERNASMIVVGKRGLGRIAGFVLGSVSQKLVAAAHVPVIVSP